MATRGADNEVETGEAKICPEPAGLRHVADGRIAPPRRVAEHADAACGGRDQAQYGAQQRGLAGAVGAEDTDEATLRDGE